MARESGEVALASGIVLPAPDLRDAHVGRVTARGRAVLGVDVGERIIYSSRVDAFVLDDGSSVDVVEENSVIGIMP